MQGLKDVKVPRGSALALQRTRKTQDRTTGWSWEALRAHILGNKERVLNQKQVWLDISCTVIYTKY